ncbi:MAG: dTDP-4-dehydrorhamnose 3,5-epimerase [Nitrospira sp.]|nr:dTDP-4-dehydrorhamnose 3,5-epimerase [Nitrospira sp.]
MQVSAASLDGLVVIETTLWRDARGAFVETYHQERYRDAGIGAVFVQDNFSWSQANVLRGLHYQLRHPQGKLVMVVEGRVFDVAVDIRAGSPTFGQWHGIELSAENGRQLYIPPGYAHGFCVLSERAGFMYRCTDYYHPSDERGIRWNDPQLAIDWPAVNPLVSEKDQAYKALEELQGELPQWMASR